jgi:hypothetical protein
MGYSSLAAGTSQLFAAVNNSGTRSIYRVDNALGGVVTSPVVGGSGPVIQSITNATYDWAQFGTSSAEVLMAVNGADNPLLFDGATWYALTTSSTPYALTGGPSPLSSLNQVAVYKYRMWFVQKGTMNVYYLPQNVFAGALTLLNLGNVFKLGGYIVSMVTVSIDNSAGANDYIAFITNMGEVVMFQGYDPASVSTWSVAAHYRIGRPIGTGRRTWQKVGADAVIICADGAIRLSEAMLTDRSENGKAVSDKIRKSINDSMQLYGNYPGWQMMLYPFGNKLLLNVPTSGALSTSFTYVMNTLTGAWCTFGYYASSWNAFCYETFGDNLYAGTAGKVLLVDSGSSDDSTAITALVKPAFSYFEDRARLKRFTQCQPIISCNGSLYVSLILNTDFSIASPTGTTTISTINGAIWNVSLWNVSYWGDAAQVTQNWIGLNNKGYNATLSIRIASNGTAAKWQATNYLYETGGVFYGNG